MPLVAVDYREKLNDEIVTCWPTAIEVLSSSMSPPPPVAETDPSMRLVLVPSSAPSVDNGSREPTDADVAHEGDDARGEAMQ